MKNFFFLPFLLILNLVNSQNYQVTTSITTYPTGTILDTIVSNIGTSNATLHINNTINLDNDLIIKGNISLKFYNGSFINLNGHTLTINGAMDAGAFQIFSGDGIVNGSPKIEQALPH